MFTTSGISQIAGIPTSLPLLQVRNTSPHPHRGHRRPHLPSRRTQTRLARRLTISWALCTVLTGIFSILSSHFLDMRDRDAATSWLGSVVTWGIMLTYTAWTVRSCGRKLVRVVTTVVQETTRLNVQGEGLNELLAIAERVGFCLLL